MQERKGQERRRSIRMARRRSLKVGGRRYHFVLLGVTAALALSGCSLGSPTVIQPTQPITASPASAPSAQGPMDPLSDLISQAPNGESRSDIQPALHAQGIGPQEFTVERPAADVKRLTFYISCKPDSTFKVTIGLFYSGPCSVQFLNTGGIPVPAGSGPIAVRVDIPADVEYWVVAIPST
jgi:hypothetical protein